jgi:hypothetical protein
VAEDWAQRQPGRPALLSGGQSFTYGELAARRSQYARWARGVGICTGSAVCLLMQNRPDYLACWLGINGHESVRMSRARSRRSPITGAIVVADIILVDGADAGRQETIRAEILGRRKEPLAAYNCWR